MASVSYSIEFMGNENKISVRKKWMKEKVSHNVRPKMPIDEMESTHKILIKIF